MRFYRINRTYRIGLTALWGGILLLYAVQLLLHPGHHPYRLLLWVFLAIVQLATVWPYVEVTDDALVSHFFFFKRSTPLNQLRYAGVPRSKSRLLSRSLEIETMNDPPTYLSVEEQNAFLQTLQDRGYAAQPTRHATGPLGLSL